MVPVTKTNSLRGQVALPAVKGAHMNEIDKMEWIGYGQKPIVALFNFMQDKILYSHKIKLISKCKNEEGIGEVAGWKILTRPAKNFDPWRLEEVNERYMPRHASDNPLTGG